MVIHFMLIDSTCLPHKIILITVNIFNVPFIPEITVEGRYRARLIEAH